MKRCKRPWHLTWEKLNASLFSIPRLHSREPSAVTSAVPSARPLACGIDVAGTFPVGGFRPLGLLVGAGPWHSGISYTSALGSRASSSGLAACTPSSVSSLQSRPRPFRTFLCLSLFYSRGHRQRLNSGALM